MRGMLILITPAQGTAVSKSGFIIQLKASVAASVAAVAGTTAGDRDVRTAWRAGSRRTRQPSIFWALGGNVKSAGSCGKREEKWRETVSTPRESGRVG